MAEEYVVNWKDEYSVKNKVIDEQHKTLIQMTNDLYAGCREGGLTERVTFMKTIQGAVNYAKTHFSTEEALMRQADYPEFDAHKEEHENFVAEVMGQIKQFEKGPGFNPKHFINFLLNWVLNHIAGSDRKYIPYLRD